MKPVESRPDAPLGALLAELSSAGHRARAIVDGARVFGLAEVLDALGLQHRALLSDPHDPTLERVSPRLVDLGSEPAERAAQLEAVPGLTAAAIFVTSAADFDDLVRHLKRFLWAEDVLGRKVLFRFWDPRVLEAFLEASSDAERAAWFGPMDAAVTWGTPDPELPGRPGWTLRPAPRAGAGEDVALPDGLRPLALRIEHDRAWSRRALARFEARAVSWLRGAVPDGLRGAEDTVLRAIVDEARELGPALGLVCERDICLLARHLAWQGRGETCRALKAVPEGKRSARLLALCRGLGRARSRGLERAA